MSSWIPIAEQLPPYDKPVWLCIAGESDSLRVKRLLSCMGQQADFGDATHWSPIAEPDDIPDAPQASLDELLALLLKGVGQRSTLEQWDCCDPERWRVDGVPVIRRLREYVESQSSALTT